MAIERMEGGSDKRMSQVNVWLETGKKEIEEAAEIQRQMEDRLSSVLRPNQLQGMVGNQKGGNISSIADTSRQPSDEKQKETVGEEIVPLANEIRGIVWGLARISRSYKSMLSRLELP